MSTTSQNINIVTDLSALAKDMMDSASNSMTRNEYGDKHGDYFTLAENASGAGLYVAATEVANIEVTGKPYYTIHVVDDITERDCELHYTDDLSEDAVVRVLEEIVECFSIA